MESLKVFLFEYNLLKRFLTDKVCLLKGDRRKEGRSIG